MPILSPKQKETDTMKKMKYLLALCLILAAASAFAACGNNSNVADTSMVEIHKEVALPPTMPGMPARIS